MVAGLMKKHSSASLIVMTKIYIKRAWFVLAVSCAVNVRAGDGVLRDGAGARALALGGASVASPDQPIEAMYSNPGGLGFVDAPSVQLGAAGGFVGGSYSSPSNPNSSAHLSGGAFPEFAVAYPL